MNADNMEECVPCENDPALSSNTDHPVDANWHKRIIIAIKIRKADSLEKLLHDAALRRHQLVHHREVIIAAVGIAVRIPLQDDFRSALEMLMYLICEYGDASELIMFFSRVFYRAEHPGAEVEFFLPNIQGTLLRLQEFRLFWLTSALAQIDHYVGNFGWNSEDKNASSNFDHLLRMQALVCDFIAPFVEDVKLARSTFSVPTEKNFSKEVALQKYRDSLGRSLLHLLATPLGVMPVSFAKGLASYTRIVALLGQVVPDYSVFIAWNQMDKRKGEQPFTRGEDTKDLMFTPVSTDSIAHLAYLVKLCGCVPNNFPPDSPPLYFLNEIVLPFADFRGSLKQQNLVFLEALLDQITERSMDRNTLSPLFKGKIVDLLKNSHSTENVENKTKIHSIAQKYFTRMNLPILAQMVGEIWTVEGISNSAANLEILVMAVKKPIVESLRDASAPGFSQQDYRYLFRLFFLWDAFSPDACTLLAEIVETATTVLTLDNGNQTGVRTMLRDIRRFHDRWTKVVDKRLPEVKKELWSRREAEHLSSITGGRSGTSQNGSTVPERSAGKKQQSNAERLILSLENLSTQINRMSDH